MRKIWGFGRLIFFNALVMCYFLGRDISKKQMLKMWCTVGKALGGRSRVLSSALNWVTIGSWARIISPSFNFPLYKIRAITSEAGGWRENQGNMNSVCSSWAHSPKIMTIMMILRWMLPWFKIKVKSTVIEFGYTRSTLLSPKFNGTDVGVWWGELLMAIHVHKDNRLFSWKCRLSTASDCQSLEVSYIQ